MPEAHVCELQREAVLIECRASDCLISFQRVRRIFQDESVLGYGGHDEDSLPEELLREVADASASVQRNR